MHNDVWPAAAAVNTEKAIRVEIRVTFDSGNGPSEMNVVRALPLNAADAND